MALTVGEARRQLETIELEEPARIRKRALEVLIALADAEMALSLNYAMVDGEPHYARISVAGESDVDFMLNQEGRPSASVGLWNPAMPRSREHQRFVGMHYGPVPVSKIRKSSAFQQLYAPMGVYDHARILLYDGKRFLGWVGCFRSFERHFEPETLDRLNRVNDAMAAVYVTAERLDRESLAAPAHLVLDPSSGAPLFASDEVASWLTAGRREHLASVIGRARHGRSLPCRVVIDGWLVRLCRLDGTSGHVVLASITGLDLPELAPTAMLTPRQQEVAELATVGATNAEIARHLDISAETVKSHMKNVYDRLGVASRLELSQVLSTED